MQTSLISTMSRHRCRATYRLTLQSTSRVEDRYVYLRSGRIFLLTELDEATGKAKGRRVAHQRVVGLLNGLDMTDVLIFRVETKRACREEEVIDPSKVLGKVVVVGEYGSVVLWSMLRL